MADTTPSSSASSRDRATNVSGSGPAFRVAMTISWRARMACRRSCGGAMDIRPEYHAAWRSGRGPGAANRRPRRGPVPHGSTCSTRPASNARSIAFTGPIEVGAIDSERNPSPISAMASSGRPPISPHTVNSAIGAGGFLDHALQRAQHGPAQAGRNGRRPGGSRGRWRTETASGRWSRSRGNRRAAQISLSWNSSEGTSSMAPSFRSAGSG